MSSERLDELVIPEKPVDPERLSRILSPYLRLTDTDGRFHYQQSYSDLPASKKVLVVLSGELARNSLGLSDDEWLSPVEIARYAGLELGTAYPALRSLEQEGVAENDDGKYRADPSEFTRIVERIGR